MSKIKIKMKLQGFELEIEGSKEDIPIITQGITQQLTSLIQAPGQIFGDDEPNESPSRPQDNAILIETKTKKPAKRRPNNTTTTSIPNGGPNVLDWVNDPKKYSTPSQKWNTANKAIWLLYVCHEELSASEMDGTVIANTFNKHFKQSGMIKNFNVSRDLGKLKISKGPPSPIGENTTKNPTTWFLTEEGMKKAKALISERLSEA